MINARLSRSYFLSVCVFSLGLILAANAQSPTENFIRIQSLRSANSAPRAIVTHTQLTSRGGFIRSRVTVTAPTWQLARRAAIRHAYSHALRVVVVPSRRLEAMADSLAAATVELKAAQAHILSEKKTVAGYTTEVEVNQSTASLVQDIRRDGLSSYRLVALLPETIDGERVAAPQVETALIGALADQQFQVYDWNYVAAQKQLLSLVSATLSNRPEAASQLGTRFLADTLIAGRVAANFSQDNNGIISYIATANVRMIRVDTGQILIARVYIEKGFGQDKPQAARQALAALAQTVAKELPAELSAHAGQHSMTIQMVSAQAQPPEQTAQFLRGLPGVTEVQPTPGTGGDTFRITSREKPAALGAWIAQSQDYRVAGYGSEDR